MERKFLEELVRKWTKRPKVEAGYPDNPEGVHLRSVDAAKRQALDDCASDLRALLAVFPED